MATKPIDRQTTTPFLLNLYYRTGHHHNPNDFLQGPVRNPLQVYTWQDATLREISHIITSAVPSAFPSPLIGTRLSFQMVYPDTKPNTPPRYLAKTLGSVVMSGAADDDDETNGHEGSKRAADSSNADANRTLGESRFIIGDYMSVAILPPLANGDVAPASAAMASASSSSGPPMRRDDRDRGPRDPYRDRERGGTLAPPREDGFGGGGGRFGDRGYGGGGGRGGRYGDFGGGGVPPGEWRRGDEPPGSRREYGGPRDGGYGRPRGRGRGW